MAKRKLSALVQAMTLFNQLDERDKITLSDYIKSVTATPRPKSTTAPPAVKRSSKKSEGTSSTVSTATGKDNAGIVLPDDPDEFHKGAAA